jgi:hypothetical protein
LSGLSRKVGVVGFILSVGVACTQLFGGDRQNTLAPLGTAGTRSISTSPVLPTPPGAIAVCETAQFRCEGALLQTCADDRTSWVTLQQCAAAALCQPNPAACLAASCSADEMTCNGAVLQKCNVDRTGWDVFDTCLSPAHCNADQRQCLTEPCQPGDRRCDRSETDQSPVLEVCRDDGLDWGPLDACVTRELCDQTLTIAAPGGGLVLGSDGMVQVQAPASPQTVLKCNLPACAVGEVRCEGARLEFCSEGRTGWITAEECASAELCAGSLMNVGTAGTPVCLTPACAAGQHRCTDTGMLQVCSDDRTGFRDLEACIGPPFCNAVLADQGEKGCRDAPCDPGQMQCNGAQIQLCRDDQTGLDDTGAPCESAALCNADDPTNVVCDEPLCRRGATSGNEFHCEGAQLQRCNESLTVYDTIQTCVTPALCDASQRFNGCKPPACQPGGHACSNGFLQTCNANQTGYDNVENCGSQAQCDANAGRCADPCEPGATRCNSATGDLERCRDRLTGWQPIADCQSLALCDAANGRCNICFGGDYSCADNQLRQCAPDGRTFARQNVPAECAPAQGGGSGVRVCQNNQVTVNPCQFGCSNGRCNECAGNTSQCVGNGQIRRCVNGFFGAPTSCTDGNACNGVESCQNNNCVGGQAPNCNDGNQCTNDSCSSTSGCQFAGFSSTFQCINNGSQVQGCSNGQLQTNNCTGNLGCTGGRCNNCNQGACANGTQFQTCDNGQISGPKNCPANQICQNAGNCVFNCQQLNCNDNNACTNDNCSAQAGCQHSNVANGSGCGDNNACNGADSCQNGQCATGAPRNCNDNRACTSDSCNPATGACSNTVNCAGGQTCNAAGACAAPVVCNAGAFAGCNGTTAFNRCNGAGTGNERVDCAGGQICDAGQQRCVTPPPRCTTGTCNGNQFTPCVNGQPGTPQTCPDDAANNQCVGPVCSAAGCGLQNLTSTCISNGNNGRCQGGICQPNQTCTPNSFLRCLTNDLIIENCNATGTGTVSRTCTQPNQICSATAGACVNLACAAGQERCLNGVPQRCRADRMGFQNIATCEGTVSLSCPTANSTAITRFQCNRDANPCTAEFCIANQGCGGTALSAGTACTTGGRAGQCGNLDAVCHVACTVRTDCPLGTDVCTAGQCVPGCTVTGCGVNVCDRGSGICIRLQ